MARQTAININSIPIGPLGIIGMPGCEALTDKIDKYLVKWRKTQAQEHAETIAFYGYQRDTYKINVSIPRFGSGEGKGVINESVRGYDIYIIADVFNYSCTYNMYGMTVPKSPDDHFADLKRVIHALSSKPKRVSVIMPMLYEGRQHKRSARESLDCAMALQELVDLGVDNIITFDAHDQRVQNSIPDQSFENVMPTYQMIKALVNNVDDLSVNKDHLMIISPDEGAMQRCIYFATQLGVNLGMFYKRRDYTKIVNGRNPIVEHQYLGDSVEGKDIIIVDDIISSGESMVDTARQLKAMKAKRVFICATFGLFTNGLEEFDKAFTEGVFEKLFTTNLCYRPPELLKKPYYIEADMSNFLASIIDFMNHDLSMENVSTPTEKIQNILELYNDGTVIDEK